MVEETFVAPTPQEAFILAKQKYGEFSSLKLKKARQILDREGNLVSEITVEVDEESYMKSIGVDVESELIEEMEQLKEKIGVMKGFLTGEKSIVTQKVSELFLERGIRKEWIDSIIREVSGTSIALDEKLLIAYMLETIDDSIEIKKERLNEPKIVMMVGPTGVGKTTTIAKLAARYKFAGKKSMDAAIINLDTFRAGAYHQLDSFATLLKMEHRYVKNVDEFPKVLDELSHYPVILIDTAGISPYDSSRLIETVEFVKSVKDKSIEKSLVLSAASKYDDMSDIYEHFSFIDIDSMVVTKFDETRRVGDLIAFMMDKKIPVSYMSMGQQVPDDLEPASREKLLEYFVGELNV